MAGDAGMSVDTISVVPLVVEHAGAVSELADSLIGVGYFPPAAVVDMVARSTVGGIALSWVAFSAERAVGFRFTLPPGRWEQGRGHGLSPEAWPAPREHTAYFQSAFVHPAVAGKGIGRRMAEASIDGLVRIGAQAVVAHSWKESPGGSSMRYLEALGFVSVAEYPRYWSTVDYICTRDGYPCQCTAVEMVLDLRGRLCWGGFTP